MNVQKVALILLTMFNSSEVEMRFEYPEKNVNQKYKDYIYKTIGLHNNWDEYVVIEDVKMWAYIDNLLPKQFRKYEQVKGD